MKTCLLIGEWSPEFSDVFKRQFEKNDVKVYCPTFSEIHENMLRYGLYDLVIIYDPGLINGLPHMSSTKLDSIRNFLCINGVYCFVFRKLKVDLDLFSLARAQEEFLKIEFARIAV